MIRHGKPYKLFKWFERHGCEHLLNRSKIMINRPEADCVDAVIQIVAKANRTLFEEIIKEEKNMRAFVELIQPEFDEAVKKAANETANKVVTKAVDEAVIETTNIVTAQNKVEAVENAIRKLNMTKEEACDFMDITTTQYDTYKQILQDAAGATPQKYFLFFPDILPAIISQFLPECTPSGIHTLIGGH